ncbi:MAG: hypothetical protein A3G24_15505 [Betaproteobacteria bacterium RIFCSPLOWO2_12_FULL_62_13]|nr:MAG: hypothetical protein A3G24_15505 [Betaproteobacteria bacterium RIFCSPLOWO2_12_FULL_62_13]
MNSIFTILAAVSSAAIAFGAGGYYAVAQTFPVKPVRVIAPFPPGGGVDASARIIGQALSESLGQQVVIDNRPGASARIGTELAAKAAPDGYTLLLGSVGPNAIIPSAYRSLPYDSIKDFAPVSLVATSAYVLVVHPSLPVKSVKELIALAGSQPGKLDFASTGNLGGPHLCGELFKSLAKVNIVHIAYKGGSPQMTALLSGEVSLAFASLPTAMPHVKAGRLRALGVTSGKRLATVPELPAIAEVLPGYEVLQWYGMLAPAGTPREIIAKLHGEIVKAVNTPKVKEQFQRLGSEAASNTPEEFAAHIKAEIAKYGKLIKATGIPVE